MEQLIYFKNDLRKLEAWAKDWGMRFNAKKSYIAINEV
jgi:hypothetical protein